MNKANKTPSLIIMLSGLARGGKDTVAEIIRQELNLGIVTENNGFFSEAVTLGFADILKKLARRNHGYRNKKDDRRVLLDIGDEMRGVDEDVFVKPIVHFIDVYRELGYQAVIITDTRFKNEYDYINKYASGIPYVIRIESENGHKGIEDEYIKEHKTEQLDFDYDYLLKVPFLDKDTYPEFVSEIRRVLCNIIDDYRGRTTY